MFKRASYFFVLNLKGEHFMYKKQKKKLCVLTILSLAGECKIFCVNRKKEVPSVE